jgi:hypothetical protein
LIKCPTSSQQRMTACLKDTSLSRFESELTDDEIT